MSKAITYTYKGVDYTLEFTRASVRAMERKGFRPEDIADKPMTTLPELFKGAFIAHHPYIKPELVEEMFNRTPHRTELIGKLAELYNEPINAMMDEPEDSEENPTWNATW